MEELQKHLFISNFSTMKRFLTQLAILAILVIGIQIIPISRYSIIPFSVSVSTDAKIYELKQRHLDTIENIAIGSSMTLNNLYSETLTKHLRTDSYWNMSSWGRSITETKEMIEIMVPLYHPSNVFVISYCGDFHDASMGSTKTDVQNYLTTENKLLDLFYMAKYQIRCRFEDEDQQYKQAKANTTHYASLDYDRYGGVVLNIYGENISAKRMSEHSNFSFDTTNQSYTDLINMCEYLQAQNIKLYFVNTPTKSNFYTHLEDVEKHILYCDSIVSHYGHCYINEMLAGKYSEDTITFADNIHLNQAGAIQLTKEICKHL